MRDIEDSLNFLKERYPGTTFTLFFTHHRVALALAVRTMCRTTARTMQGQKHHAYSSSVLRDRRFQRLWGVPQGPQFKVFKRFKS